MTPRLPALIAVVLLFGGAVPMPSAAAAEPERVSIFESGGVGRDVYDAVATAAAASGATVVEFHEGTVRLVQVNRGGIIVQQAPEGMAYPMATTATDPTTAGPLVGREVVATLAAGEVVFGEVSAKLRGARVGDVVSFIGWDGALHGARIGLIVPDAAVGWAEMTFSLERAASFGMDRLQGLVVYGFDSRDRFEIALHRLLPDRPIRVRGAGASVNPDFVLPTALIKERFGEFAYAPAGGSRIRIDQSWVERNIVVADLPIVGAFRCHRLTVPQLRGAFEELERRDLGHLIDRANFRIAGGCYNPRQTRGGDKGFRISRHAWGAAFDMNTADNPYGGEVGMDRRVAQVLRDWGFAWGGNWTFPDGGHFEWKAAPRWGRAAGVSPGNP